MGRLVISHHKSYHVYNRDNIDKVRKDEAKEKLRLELEEQRLHVADSERRLALLRGSVADVPKDDDLNRDTGSVGSLSISAQGSRPARKTENPAQIGHINFWPELENKATMSSASRSKRTNDSADKLEATKEEEWKGVSLIDAAGPNGTGLRPWYSSGPNSQTSDTKSKFEDMVSRADASWKERNDPLNTVRNGLKRRDSGQSDERHLDRRMISSKSQIVGQATRMIVNHASEASRAAALKTAHRRRERYGTPSSVPSTPRGDNWYEALNRR